MAGLRCGIAPIGRDGADHDAVAGTEAFHFRADFMNDADGLVAEREVFTWPDRAMDGMRVGGAYEGAGGLDDRVVGAGFRSWLVREADLVQRLHHECFHQRFLPERRIERRVPVNSRPRIKQGAQASRGEISVMSNAPCLACG